MWSLKIASTLSRDLKEYKVFKKRRSITLLYCRGMAFLKIEAPVSAEPSRQSRHIWGTSRLEPWPPSATSGCSNTICWSRSLTSAPRSHDSRKPHFLLSVVCEVASDLNLVWRHICPQGGGFLSKEFSLCCYVVVDGRCSRWLIPCTIPGASQLFKSLLTRGDNPVKAAKHHVRRGRGRQQGYIQGPKGSVMFQPWGIRLVVVDQDHFNVFPLQINFF